MKVSASNGVIRVDLKKIMAGGGVSGQPENPPVYATVRCHTTVPPAYLSGFKLCYIPPSLFDIW